jgi:hypothetical protein
MTGKEQDRQMSRSVVNTDGHASGPGAFSVMGQNLIFSLLFGRVPGLILSDDRRQR